LHTAFSTLATSVDSALNNNLKPLTNKVQNGSYIAATYADRPTTGVANGATMFVTDTKARYYFDGTVWVLIYQPWTTFTPVLANGSGTALTNITVADTGRYMVSDNVVYVQVSATVTGAPANFAAMDISFPLTSASPLHVSLPIGDGVYVKGADLYPLKVMHTSTSKGLVKYQSKDAKLVAVNKTSATAGVPIIQANGDIINFNFSYKL
jgi:hypothetical protein